MVDKSKRFELIHEIMSTRGNILDLNDLCQTAGVSRSSYYKWIRSEDVRREKEEKDRADFELVLEAFKHRGYDKGVRGINMYLLHRKPQIIMNPKKIRRLMHKYGLLCPIRKANPYRRMAAALKTSNYAGNLVKR